MSKEKWLYRLESINPDNGLWYNSANEYVWGCKDCKGEAKNLPMGYDERYHIDGKNWFSDIIIPPNNIIIINSMSFS